MQGKIVQEKGYLLAFTRPLLYKKIILSTKKYNFFLRHSRETFDIIPHMKQDFDYRGSLILGMHDAIVSLTGLIAGLGIAFTNRNVIILSCIISSITASLSMGAANYLAVKTTNQSHALYAALYTACAYMATCILLILPFFVFSNRNIALLSVAAIAILIIYLFNRIFYTRGQFTRHFYEMLSICIAVSIISFAIGQTAKHFIGQ